MDIHERTEKTNKTRKTLQARYSSDASLTEDQKKFMVDLVSQYAYRYYIIDNTYRILLDLHDSKGYENIRLDSRLEILKGIYRLDIDELNKERKFFRALLEHPRDYDEKIPANIAEKICQEFLPKTDFNEEKRKSRIKAEDCEEIESYLKQESKKNLKEITMDNIETAAKNVLELLNSFKDNSSDREKLARAFSDKFGNIAEKIEEDRVEIDKKLNRYKKDKKKERESQYNPMVRDFSDQSYANLKSELDQFDEFLKEEVLPILQNDLKNLSNKAQKGDLKVEKHTNDDITKMAENVTKIISSGKKVWDLVKDYKKVFVSIGSLLAKLL